MVMGVSTSGLEDKNSLLLQHSCQPQKEFLGKKINGWSALQGFSQVRDDDIKTLLGCFDKMSSVPKEKPDSRVSEGALRPLGKILLAQVYQLPVDINHCHLFYRGMSEHFP